MEEKCSVRLGNGVIEFRLLKTEEKLWGKLNETKSKEEMASKRQEAILASQKREKELKDERAKRKREEEQFAIREQMKLEQTKRENMEKQKQVYIYIYIYMMLFTGVCTTCSLLYIYNKNLEVSIES